MSAHHGTRAYQRFTYAIIIWSLILFGVPFLGCVFLLAVM